MTIGGVVVVTAWSLDLKLPVHSVPITNTVVSSNKGRGNWSTRIKPPSCRESLKTVSHNIVSSTPRHKRDASSQ